MSSIATKYFDLFPFKFWFENFVACAMFNDYTDERKTSHAFYNALRLIENDPSYPWEARDRAKELMQVKKVGGVLTFYQTLAAFEAFIPTKVDRCLYECLWFFTRLLYPLKRSSRRGGDIVPASVE